MCAAVEALIRFQHSGTLSMSQQVVVLHFSPALFPFYMLVCYNKKCFCYFFCASFKCYSFSQFFCTQCAVITSKCETPIQQNRMERMYVMCMYKYLYTANSMQQHSRFKIKSKIYTTRKLFASHPFFPALSFVRGVS